MIAHGRAKPEVVDEGYTWLRPDSGGSASLLPLCLRLVLDLLLPKMWSRARRRLRSSTSIFEMAITVSHNGPCKCSEIEGIRVEAE